MKTTVSFEIPVHQKLTVGTNKTQSAAMCFLCVSNFTINSNTLHEAIDVKKEKTSVAPKYDLKVKKEIIDAILQINHASGSLNNHPGGYPVSTLKCAENISGDGSLSMFSIYNEGDLKNKLFNVTAPSQ